MSDAKKANAKNKATGTKVQPGAKAKGGKPATLEAGATDVLTQENTNQAGQSNSEQTTGKENTSLGTQVESPTPGEQGDNAGSQGTDKDLQIAANIVSGLAALAKSEPKATTEKRARIAKDLFAKKSGLSIIYFTSDLVPFGTENDAKRHAAKLDNKIVTPITKED